MNANHVPPEMHFVGYRPPPQELNVLLQRLTNYSPCLHDPHNSEAFLFYTHLIESFRPSSTYIMRCLHLTRYQVYKTRNALDLAGLIKWDRPTQQIIIDFDDLYTKGNTSKELRTAFTSDDSLINARNYSAPYGKQVAPPISRSKPSWNTDWVNELPPIRRNPACDIWEYLFGCYQDISRNKATGKSAREARYGQCIVRCI